VQHAAHQSLTATLLQLFSTERGSEEKNVKIGYNYHMLSVTKL